MLGSTLQRWGGNASSLGPGDQWFGLYIFILNLKMSPGLTPSQISDFVLPAYFTTSSIVSTLNRCCWALEAKHRCAVVLKCFSAKDFSGISAEFSDLPSWQVSRPRSSFHPRHQNFMACSWFLALFHTPEQYAFCPTDGSKNGLLKLLPFSSPSLPFPFFLFFLLPFCIFKILLLFLFIITFISLLSFTQPVRCGIIGAHKKKMCKLYDTCRHYITQIFLHNLPLIFSLADSLVHAGLYRFMWKVLLPSPWLTSRGPRNTISSNINSQRSKKKPCYCVRWCLLKRVPLLGPTSSWSVLLFFSFLHLWCIILCYFTQY